MGIYGKTTVVSTVLQIDIYPHRILLETKDFVDFTNGRAMTFPEGVMVVVGHSNTEGWGPDWYDRSIHVVSTTNWHPNINPEDGDNAIIGYWDHGPKSCNERKYEVKRKELMCGDPTIEGYLKEEGRWPYKD